MKRLHTVEEYKKLIREVRTKHKNLFSNIYYMSVDIQRYIDLERAYYEEIPGGLLLIFDEERYYRVCMYVDVMQDLSIPQMDKKIVLKNVYRKGKEETELEIVEKVLKSQGFEKEGTVVQVKGNVSCILERCRKLERYVNKMEMKGFRCVVADETYLDKIESMLFASEKVRDYQIDYRTSEEKRVMKEGTYLCVLNSEDEICAVNACYMEGQTAYGEGVAIEEQYKMHGLAPIMTFHRFKHLADNNVTNILAWILTDNEASLRFHTSVGYELVNKYIDEWVRN